MEEFSVDVTEQPAELQISTYTTFSALHRLCAPLFYTLYSAPIKFFFYDVETAWRCISVCSDPCVSINTYSLAEPVFGV